MTIKTILLIASFIFIYGCHDIPQHIKTGLEGKPIPSVDLLLFDSSTHINTDKSRPGSPTTLIYINPNCPFCNGLIQDVAKNMITLQHIQFYIIASSPLYDINKFAELYHLAKYKNVHIGLDDKEAFMDYFRPQGYPYIAVYKPNGTLSAVFLGKLDTREIEKASKID